MCGYSDLTAYESDAERNAACAELARMLRIVPLDTLSTVTRSGTGDPSPADTAVRGGLIEDLA